ncbi:MAG: RidA family protein [Bacteroidia bacterium]|nr:RidA family protein [Bacteroidia bacterium]MCZ2249022.1 RidA family protein [Bacteroidia bacterium]
MNKEIIFTDKAPQAIGPYSQAVKSGSLIFLSGQIPINPQTGELETANVAVETHRVMKNILAVLEAAGYTLDDVVKTTIFLTSMSHFQTVNEVYASYFSGNFPARETVAVAGLPRNVNVEISMIASK